MDSLLEQVKLIRIISDDVFRAASKGLLMYGFLFLSLFFVLLANMPFLINNPQIFEGMPSRIASLNIGFMGINIFLMLISVFISLNILQEFFLDRNLIILLSKPIKRWHIAEGVFLGLFKVIFLNWLIMVSILWSIIYFHTHEFNINILSGMSICLILVLIYISLELFFYILIPNAISGILTFFVIISAFGISVTKEHLLSLPKYLFFMTKIGIEVIPKINLLFGISMYKLGIFNIAINYLPIFLHTIIFLVALHIFILIKFSQPK